MAESGLDLRAVQARAPWHSCIEQHTWAEGSFCPVCGHGETLGSELRRADHAALLVHVRALRAALREMLDLNYRWSPTREGESTRSSRAALVLGAAQDEQELIDRPVPREWFCDTCQRVFVGGPLHYCADASVQAAIERPVVLRATQDRES